MSLGKNINGDGTDPVEIAADYAVASGINFVVAAGNAGSRGENTVGIPASAFNVITVGATKDNMEIAGFSSKGPTKDGRIKPEISAVGVDVISSVPTGDCESCDPSGYRSMQGTSMATPHVAGFVALLLEHNPDLDTEEVKNILTQTAVDKGEPGSDNTYGYGVLNALETFFEINPPGHEVSLVSLDSPDFLELGKQEDFKVKINNKGLNNENINIRFLVDNIEIDNKNIDILSKAEETITFAYSTDIEGEYEIKVEIDNIPNEEITENNEKTETLKALKVEGRVKAVVVDSWGNDKAEFTIFDYLNDNWMEYGNYIVEIDYHSLDKEDITYEEIVNTNADVLIISDAWANGHMGMNHEYTDSEIQAIKQYVKQGHGLIGTSGSLSEYPENNAKLGGLFGIKEQSGLWNNREAAGGGALYGKSIDILVSDEILTKNVPVNYNPGDSSAIINLELDETKAPILVGKLKDREDVFISAYKPESGASVYFCNFPELHTANEQDKQFFYNAILWTNFNIGELGKDIELSDLNAPEKVKIDDSEIISAKIKNNGLDSEDVAVEFKVNDVLKETQTVSLDSGQEKEMTFNFIAEEIGIQEISINAILEEDNYLINNKLIEKILVPPLLLNDNYNDLGIDEDENGLYDYIQIEFGVDVFKSGEYRVEFDVTSFLGVELESVNDYVDLTTEDNIISVLVPVYNIRKMELNGPYKIKNLVITSYGESEEDGEIKGEDEETIVDSREEAFTTQAYNVNDFEKPSRFTRVFSDYAIDEDDNGLYDKLVINAEVDIQKSGDYYISSSLYQDNHIASGDFQSYLEQGIQNIELEFKGYRIRKSQINGPYELRDLRLNSENPWQEHDYIRKAYETKEYSYEDFETLIDVGVYIKTKSLIINEPSEIELEVNNEGTDIAENINVYLYLKTNEYWDDDLDKWVEELELINSDVISVDADSWESVFFPYTVNEIGEIELKAVVELKGDMNEKNNDWDREIRIKALGPDLGIYLNTYGIDYIVGQESEVNFYIENRGTEKAENVVASLYLVNEYWDENDELIEELKLINTKQLSDIEINKGVDDNLKWKPDKNGHNRLKIIVECDNEAYPGDNEYNRGVYVKINAADLDGWYKSDNYNKIINQETKIEFYIENKGVKKAEDVSASLYLIKGYPEGNEWVEELKLVDKKQLPDLEPNKGEIELSFIYTPEKIGYNRFKIRLDASNEGNYENNDIYLDFNIIEKSIINNFLDSELNGRLLMKVLKLNEEWEDFETIFEDNVNVPAKESLALYELWENSGGFSSIKEGDYKVSAEFETESHGVLEASGRFGVWD